MSYRRKVFVDCLLCEQNVIESENLAAAKLGSV